MCLEDHHQALGHIASVDGKRKDSMSIAPLASGFHWQPRRLPRKRPRVPLANFFAGFFAFGSVRYRQLKDLQHMHDFEDLWAIESVRSIPLQTPREICHWKSYTSAPCVCTVVHADAAGSRTDADADDS